MKNFSQPPKQLPKAFEQALLTYLKTHYLKKSFAMNEWNERDTSYFSRGIIALNQSFTEMRSQKYFNYFNDPVLRSGYLAYFLTVNAMKAFHILSLYDTPKIETDKSDTIYVADVGAGPLTLSFGLIFSLAEKIKKPTIIKIDAFEQNKKILTDGIDLMHDYIEKSGLKKLLTVQVRENIVDLKRPIKSLYKYDYLLFGNVLNEFDERSEQQSVVQQIISRFSKPKSRLLFIEPASKKFSRDLQALRDHLITESEFRVLAPCLHQETCPLNLTAKTDWCNFYQDWEAPKFIKNFDDHTHLKKTYLMYSYLFMTNNEELIPTYDTQMFRSITDTMKEKGRLELIGCGPAGRIRFVRSHKDETIHNADFNKIRRGTVFKALDYEHSGEYELEKRFSIKSNHKFDVR